MTTREEETRLEKMIFAAYWLQQASDRLTREASRERKTNSDLHSEQWVHLPVGMAEHWSTRFLEIAHDIRAATEEIEGPEAWAAAEAKHNELVAAVTKIFDDAGDEIDRIIEKEKTTKTTKKKRAASR